VRLYYEGTNFKPATLDIIDHANDICAEYAAQGFDLTLRQLYYQFVSRDLLRNKQSEYNRLGNIINDARLAGMLDWDYIVDRGRFVRSLSHWSSPESVIDSAAASFRTDLWRTQPTRVEVWIEKDALSGVIGPACTQLDVPYFACKGYVSQSEMWAAAQRLQRHLDQGQAVTVLHLGDHDPSGIDMTRDIQSRLDLFTRGDQIRKLVDRAPEGEHTSYVKEHWDPDRRIEVKRIALTMAQIEEYDPPPNPAKVTDSRFADYERIYGDESWELDALDPTTLAALIREHVGDIVDDERMELAVAEETTQRELVTAVSDRWDEVVAFLEGTQS
jgi:hypothetical protein